MSALISSPPAADPGAIVAGNVYPKYTTRNPLARLLVANFMSTLRQLVWTSRAREVHEVGCGEGYLSLMLATKGLRVRGSDGRVAEVVSEARRQAAARGLGVAFEVADLYALEPGRDGAELVLCCEVLEHLPDPARALQTLAALARPYLILSAPREPLWRALNLARGRYWRDLGNTPGHLQHWSTPAFVALLEEHLCLVELCTPLPWTMALCRAR